MDHLRQIAADNIDLLLECGFNKPGCRLDLSDRVNIVQAVTLHKVVLVSMAELSQFQEGLCTLGVCDALKKNPHLLNSYYCREYNDELSSGKCSFTCADRTFNCHFLHVDSIRKLFTDIKYSETGSIHRQHEERAFMYFIDYLDDCEKGYTGFVDRLADLLLKYVFSQSLDSPTKTRLEMR